MKITSEGQFSKQPSQQQCQCQCEIKQQSRKEQPKELVICSLNPSMMTLPAVIAQHPVSSLLDSGASGNFLTAQFISRFHIPTTTVKSKAVRLADGNVLQANQTVVDVPVTVNDKTVHCDFMVLSELNNGHDCILGLPWLERANPIINFRERTIEWRRFESQQHLPARSINHNIASKSVVGSSKTSTQLNSIHPTLLNRNMTVEPEDEFLIVKVKEVKPKPKTQLNQVSIESGDRKISSSARQLIQQYADVFPAELPKRLPLVRDEADLRIHLQSN